MALADQKEAIAWLAQFMKSDRPQVAELLNSILQVAYHDFVNDLKSLIRRRSKDSNGPIALYAEREVKKRLGIPHRLFKESNKVPKRAVGSSILPVAPIRAYDPEVGSEGLVAQMITELCREDPKLFINHPGPDRIRKKRVRVFFLITDVIGSGERVCNYLEAAWRVRSVRSWHSLKLLKFEVLAYSATQPGQKRVKKHPCEPAVSYVQPCPTIDTSFTEFVAERMKELCVEYDPIDHNPVDSLGHLGTGVLLTFAHGAPNNIPRMLHKKGKAWNPLFPSKVPEAFRADFRRDRSLKAVVDKMNRIRQTRLAKSRYLMGAHPDARLLMLVLAALTRGPRFNEAVAGKTGLTIAEVRKLVADAYSVAWIDNERRLTDEGHRQLEYARLWRPEKSSVVFEVNEPYYPKALRAPRLSS